MSLEQQIEIMNKPTKDGGKAIQLYIDGKPYLRFQEEQYSDHATTLKNALDQLGLKYETIKARFGGEQIPTLQGERYKVCGMGIVVVYRSETNRFDLIGNSGEYKIGINREHLELLKELLPEWKINEK